VSIILGIDPGAGGGLASWYDNEMCAVKMPATEKDICDWAADFCETGAFAYIERVHAMPGQGVTSMFSFGRNYGFLRGCLIAHGIPFEEVTPRTWQKTFGLKKAKGETPTAWKNRLKAKAQQLFPELKVTLATADALLIAEHGRRVRGA